MRDRRRLAGPVWDLTLWLLVTVKAAPDVVPQGRVDPLGVGSRAGMVQEA